MEQNAAALVSFGVQLSTSRPSLNSHAGATNKLQQLELLSQSGIPVPKFSVWSAPSLPALARKRYHYGGKDIMPVFQQEEVSWRKAAGADFFVEFIPTASEYRVWVFRRSHLATYVKEMKRPEKYRRIGRNYKNGFAFNLVQSELVPRGAVDMAIQSVAALGLDFGAVDILKGTDGNFYVLEVNTAPGVEGSLRQGIRALASKIARWEELGYPNRRSLN